VRQQLGIPSDHTAVLYAPTWRDRVVSEDDPEGVSLTLDVEAFSAALSSSHTLLLRLHHYIAGRFADVAAPSCLNVSGHPDISDLYLAADVLVTDYSSAMFDFAVTGKPLLFLAPDLESYRDEMRGFYFDFEADAPGPILRRTDELVQALVDATGTADSHAGAYGRFRERFCALEDGNASRRVVEAVFGGGPA
jgi:CDP-glycerol glycerophosphotransferase